MYEVINDKVWEFFQKKEISLAMIFDIDGRIVWNRGREVKGKTIGEGSGFSKTYIKEALVNGKLHRKDGIMVSMDEYETTQSVRSLLLKSLLINQINDDCFLYIDSTSVDSFNCKDCEAIFVLGEILGSLVGRTREKETETGGIAGTSDVAKKIRKLIDIYSMNDEPLLITGETGTGKTHIAELIHNCSGRNGKFVVVNTPTIPENLFESELFGHKKGAFTNASYDKKGLVEEAEGGTLLIDEITEVSVALQAKLLRFIETGKFTRLGETSERPADVRIIAATNKDLHDAIERGEFREDLYYRLSVFEIELPPLRERKEDIEALVLEKREYMNDKEIGIGFWEAVYDHNWPGNVRELISVLKRAGVLDKDTITGDDITAIIKKSFRHRKMKSAEDGSLQLWDDLREGKSFWETVKEPFMARELKRSEVKAVIDRGLVESNGTYKRLAKMFNLEENDYHRFMRFLYDQEFIPNRKVTG
jgi:transcriptional regulator with PAS, ATPase and Fis domain